MKMSKTRMAVLGTLCAAAFTAAGVGAGVAIADQPNMNNALHDLENAQGQLQVAAHDKGGHRENALNLVNQAINEVNLGIQYAGD
jgi:hypothetical protein